MNYRLGLRTLALLAIVAASTAVLVAPELFQAPADGNASTPRSPILLSTLALGHG